MKTRTPLPLLFTLGFLMLSAANGRAQLNLTPDDVIVSFDSALITYNMDQTGAVYLFKVRGSIMSYFYTGSFTVKMPFPKQWSISTKIGGVVVQSGDIVGITANQTLPVEIIATPKADGPDTESFCLALSNNGKGLSIQCLSLAITNATSAVNPDLPASNITITPNPAASYILARGLTGAQAGCNYEIYSVSGAEIRHGLLPSDARIDVQDLSSGAYRLLLLGGKQTFSNTAITILH